MKSMKGKKTSAKPAVAKSVKKTVAKLVSKISEKVEAKSTVVQSAAPAQPKNNPKVHPIQPIGDRILIKPFLESEAEPKNSFGIIIPETVTKEMPERGVVLAVGEGRYHDGKIIPLKVRVGDKIIFSKYGFDEVTVDNDKLYILREESVLAVINK